MRSEPHLTFPDWSLRSLVHHQPSSRGRGTNYYRRVQQIEPGSATTSSNTTESVEFTSPQNSPTKRTHNETSPALSL